jgi:hypothetical protein
MTQQNTILEAVKSLCGVSNTTLLISHTLAEWSLHQSKEISALRASVKSLDPTFTEIYERVRKEDDSDSKFVPVLAQLQTQADELSRELGKMIRIIEEIQPSTE